MRGVYPGSFDPPTIAHVAIAEAARDAAGLDHLDFALSRNALGKDDHAAPLDARVAALERLAATRPWLSVIVTDEQLIADIARGYEVVVLGADKWAQVRDPAWYASVADRDVALARLPRVLVAPRPGFAVEGAEVLDIDSELGTVSSTLAREGRHDLVAPGAHTTRLPQSAVRGSPASARRLIVDAMNVIGTRPDGWWKDRDGAARRLIASLQDHARQTGARIAVVLDGRPLTDYAEGVHEGVLVAYATRSGRDAADDRIVAEVERDAHPETLTVVTSDHGLRDRVEALGALVESAGSLLSALEKEPR